MIQKITNNKLIIGKVVFYVLIGTILLFISMKLSSFANDDAFIHFRIARNFVLHGVPYFNPGENVYSTSSFVWTIILSIIFVLTGNLPGSISIFNPLIVVLGAFVWLKLLDKITGRKISEFLKIIFVIVYIGSLLPSSVGLMETPLAILLLGVAVYYLMDDKKPGWIIAGTLVFIRLELIVFVFIFLLLFWYSSKKDILKNTIILLLPLLFFSSIIKYFYNSLIPNTVIAKQLIYNTTPNAVVHKVIYSLFPNLDFVIPYRHPFYFILDYQIIFLLMILVLVITLIGIPWVKFVKDTNKLWGLVFLLGGIIIALSYIYAKTVITQWYIPLFTIPIIFGLFSLSVPKQPLTLSAALVLTILPIAISVNYFMAAFVNINYLPDAEIKGRVVRYEEVGKILNEMFPGKKLLTSEIGSLGYYYEGTIIDGAGLISPSALKYHPMKIPEQRSDALIGAIPPQFVAESDPDIIVTYPVFVEEFDKDYAKSDYFKIIVPDMSVSLRKELNNDRIWASDELYIYIRLDLYTPSTVSYLSSQLK